MQRTLTPEKALKERIRMVSADGEKIIGIVEGETGDPEMRKDILDLAICEITMRGDYPDMEAFIRSMRHWVGYLKKH